MRISRIAAVAAAFGVLVMSWHTRAIAATQTSTLTVTATVVSSCTVSNGTLAFGTYDPTTTGSVDESATLQVKCTKGTSAAVGLDTGSHASGSMRRMTNGTDFLAYELYKETARTNVWGSVGAEAVTLGAAESNSAQTLAIYGRLNGLQDVSVGSYTDTVLVTVTF